MPQGVEVQVLSPAQNEIPPAFAGGILFLRRGLEAVVR